MARKASADKIEGARITSTVTAKHVIAAFWRADAIEPPAPDKVQRIITVFERAKETRRQVIGASQWRVDPFTQSVRAVHRHCQELIEKWESMTEVARRTIEGGLIRHDVKVARAIVAAFNGSFVLRNLVFTLDARLSRVLSDLILALAHEVEWPGATEDQVRRIVAALILIAAPDEYPKSADPGRAVRQVLEARDWALGSTPPPGFPPSA